jgi:hypothetical protein
MDPKDVVVAISTAFTAITDPTIPVKQREQNALVYAAVVGMDAANTKAAVVLSTQGSKAFVEHVFTDQESGKKLSYAEMRALYG